MEALDFDVEASAEEELFVGHEVLVAPAELND